MLCPAQNEDSTSRMAIPVSGESGHKKPIFKQCGAVRRSCFGSLDRSYRFCVYLRNWEQLPWRQHFAPGFLKIVVRKGFVLVPEYVVVVDSFGI
jgi:hypothetical protein